MTAWYAAITIISVVFSHLLHGPGWRWQPGPNEIGIWLTGLILAASWDIYDRGRSR